MSESLNRRRELRRNQTRAERLLWGALPDRKFHGLKFRRQFPVGPFVVDFACPRHHLVIELDGSYHDHVEQRDFDRQAYISTRGYTVVRFENSDVMDDLEIVLRAIEKALEAERPRE